MTTTFVKSWLTYKEAQEYCGIGRTRLWELLKDSKIKGAKDGARVRINRASLDSYLERQDYASIVEKSENRSQQRLDSSKGSKDAL